jgi:DNA-binding GntR family transcriptional regulator
MMNVHVTKSNSTSAPPAVSKEYQAFLAIKNNIIDKKFVPGQRIVVRDLEKLLGMSKTPITNALARLEQEGFLVSEHNRGFSVKGLQPAEVRKLYRLRIGLEELAVAFAIEDFSEEKFMELKAALDAYLSYDCNYYDLKRLKLDIDFHLHIAKICGNNYLIEMIQDVYERTLIGFSPAFMTPLISRFKEEHKDIVQAIQDRDVHKAQSILREHLAISLSTLDTM